MESSNESKAWRRRRDKGKGMAKDRWCQVPRPELWRGGVLLNSARDPHNSSLATCITCSSFSAVVRVTGGASGSLNSCPQMHFCKGSSAAVWTATAEAQVAMDVLGQNDEIANNRCSQE
eukprot:GHVU01138077.1.p2 GENE.GHVU01138077.1~~GHVU01138077.1.p2  ORF type:complete len:119 (-),score=9.68 GHVU01138077.1:276-632(-)